MVEVRSYYPHSCKYMRNKYLPGAIGINPRADRIVQDLFERTNYLNDEVERLRELVEQKSRLLAQKENPVEGIITLPSPTGDGFIRVSKDGVIKSYGSEVKAGYVLPLALSSSETQVTSSSETDLRVTTIPANLIKTADHIVLQCGGFVLASGGNISVTRFRGKLAGSTWFDSTDISQTINDGTAALWHIEARLPRDNDGTADIGGVFHWTGPTSFFTVFRGELTSFSSNWGTDMILKITANATISAGTQFIVSETYAVYKHSLG